MSQQTLDHVFKILLIGDAGVGKSRLLHLLPLRLLITDPPSLSILLQFSDGYFNENLQSTIGEYSSALFRLKYQLFCSFLRR
jgi:hypothetical protein